MKQAIVNGRWNLWLPDAVADWDAITGDAALDTGWEACRFRSMQRHLHYGDTFYDVGAEHGWISAIIGREFVGAENMVLFEPSPEMWQNIHKVWAYNGLDNPRACWSGFVADADADDGTGGGAVLRGWPPHVDPGAPEVGGMPYRHLNHHPIQTISIDSFAELTQIWPNALNIDVEGAELLVLRGAQSELDDGDEILKHVWVSVHPDLMEDFGHTPQELLAFMAERDRGRWQHEVLGVDHEQHHHWWR